MINDVVGKQERKRTIYFCLLAVWDKSDVISSFMDFFSDIAGGNPYKPSLFELVSQEQLRDLLQPAVKYVLTVRPSG